MSNFPFPWWDKTVTIYNKYVDPTTNHISWYKTVIKNCFWKAENSIFSMGRYGVSVIGVLTDTKSIICRIPQDKHYVNKLTWDNFTDVQRNEYFTLANEDIIILGAVDDIIDEYTSGQRSTDVVAKYKKVDACLTIETYTDNVQTGVDLAHYKITGK